MPLEWTSVTWNDFNLCTQITARKAAVSFHRLNIFMAHFISPVIFEHRCLASLKNHSRINSHSSHSRVTLEPYKTKDCLSEQILIPCDKLNFVQKTRRRIWAKESWGNWWEIDHRIHPQVEAWTSEHRNSKKWKDALNARMNNLKKKKKKTGSHNGCRPLNSQWKSLKSVRIMKTRTCRSSLNAGKRHLVASTVVYRCIP